MPAPGSKPHTSSLHEEANRKALERFAKMAEQIVEASRGVACSTETRIAGLAGIMQAIEVEHQAAKEVSFVGCKLS